MYIFWEERLPPHKTKNPHYWQNQILGASSSRQPPVHFCWPAIHPDHLTPHILSSGTYAIWAQLQTGPKAADAGWRAGTPSGVCISAWRDVVTNPNTCGKNFLKGGSWEMLDNTLHSPPFLLLSVKLWLTWFKLCYIRETTTSSVLQEKKKNKGFHSFSSPPFF